MIFYCPSCWHEMLENQERCLRCGENLASWSQKTYAVKLLRALSHPEHETQRRAVYLLGEKKITEGADGLAMLFEQTKNPFLACEVVEALGKIGGKTAFSVITEAVYHPSFVVRAEAVKALAKLPEDGIVSLLHECSIKDPSAYVRETAKAALVVREKDGREKTDG